MTTNSNRAPILTVVVPIASMSGRLANFRTWIESSDGKPISIVVVHDKHDKQTGIELEEIISSKKNSHIQLIEGIFNSPGLARNIGKSLSTTEWICFWDGDDFPLVNDFLTMIDEVSGTDTKIIAGGFTVIHELDGRRKTHRLSGNYMDEIALNPGIWRFAFRSDLINQIEFCNLKMAEDQVFLSEILLKDREIQVYEKPVYEYYIGSDYHLTKQKTAIRDLVAASKISLKILFLLPKANFRFVSILFSRQIIAALNHGDFITKIGALVVLIRAISTKPILTRFSLLKICLFVIRNKRQLL